MDWCKYRSFTNATTTNAFYQGTINLNPNGSKMNFNTWDNDDVVADVTDSYKELESKELLCNKCKYAVLGIRKNDNTKQLLCNVGEYKKTITSEKVECKHFERVYNE